MAEALHGWLVLDKPVGTGSTQVVSAVKRALRAGGYPKVKVGHGGTLDPLASGVLLIALGEATKLAGRLLDSDKVYEFTICLGETTDTLDAEGSVTGRSDKFIDGAEVEDVLVEFLGPVQQAPPAYSALKVDGKRAYDLARGGADVSLAPRLVTIHDLTYVAWWNEGVERQFVTLRAHVSKGTYIRSLARDIALALGTVGHVTHLRRSKAGPFGLAEAITLDKLPQVAKARELEHRILPLRAGLDDIPALPLTPDQAGALRQGRVLAGITADDGLHLALLDDVPVALVEVADRQARVERGFNLPMSKEDQ